MDKGSLEKRETFEEIKLLISKGAAFVAMKEVIHLQFEAWMETNGTDQDGNALSGKSKRGQRAQLHARPITRR